MLRVLIPTGLVATAALASLANPAALTAATADEAAATYGGACVYTFGPVTICTSWPCLTFGDGSVTYNPACGNPGVYGAQSVWKACPCNPATGAQVVEAVGSCVRTSTTVSCQEPTAP